MCPRKRYLILSKGYRAGPRVGSMRLFESIKALEKGLKSLKSYAHSGDHSINSYNIYEVFQTKKPKLRKDLMQNFLKGEALCA